MSKKGRSAMRLSRRDFLKFSVPATTGLVVASTSGSSLVAAAAASKPPELTGWALLYNTMLCQGPSCRACTNGCREWNVLQKPSPPEKQTEVIPLATNTWTAINDQSVDNADGTKTHNFFKAQCRHCTNASCVSACPTGAMAYHGDYTVPDQGWCIGCGYCAQACPFGVPQLGEPKHTSTKCRFCYNRLQLIAGGDKTLLDQDTINDQVIQGYTTECALRCPPRPIKALRFGKRDTLIATAKAEVAALKAGKNPYPGQSITPSLKNINLADVHLYGDDPAISGGSHVLYILEKPNSFYGLPDDPGLKNGRLFPDVAKYAAAKVPANWGTGVGTSAALAILPFWLLFRRKQQLEAAKTPETKGGAK